MSHRYWWITRPKRDLSSIPEAIKIFARIAEGKEWYGMKQLQIKFEEELASAGLKGAGERRNRRGSGGRTWAAWLRMWGLWFIDSRKRVRLTLCGEALKNGAPPVPLLTKQILNFQYPAPYFMKGREKMGGDFKIFPYRFILRLLLDEDVKYLTQEEMARFVLVVKKPTEFGSVKKKLIQFRKAPELFAEDTSAQQYGVNLKEVESIANTMINNLEFTQWIERIKINKSAVMLIPEKRGIVREYLDSPPNFLFDRVQPMPEDSDLRLVEERFVRRYGLDLKRQKDTRKFTDAPVVTKEGIIRSSVIQIYYSIIKTRLISEINEELLEELAQRAGTSSPTVAKILADEGIRPSFDLFGENFLSLSTSGQETSTEFEEATAEIFRNLGFGAKRFTRTPNPDVLVWDKKAKIIGIIDNKAMSSFTPPYHPKMEAYIDKYRTLRMQDETYKLLFFMYVSGGFGSGINQKIKQIIQKKKAGGSCITAEDLLVLLKNHRASPVSLSKLRGLFTQGREITRLDILKLWE